MRPASGFSKPQMIFISVDLPAPLSPSRPSTSPFLRVMSMPLSASTAPKLLLTFSTRRTSSATTHPRSDATDVRVGRHRDDDRDAEVETQVVGVDALDDQAVVEDPEQQRAEQATDDGPRAAGQQRAADDGRRDAVEQHRVGARRVRLHGRGANGLQHADEAGERGAEDEVADDVQPPLDAGLGGAVAIAADRDGVDAPAR